MYTLRLCKNNNQHIYKFIWQVYKHYLNLQESFKSENLSTLKIKIFIFKNKLNIERRVFQWPS